MSHEVLVTSDSPHNQAVDQAGHHKEYQNASDDAAKKEPGTEVVDRDIEDVFEDEGLDEELGEEGDDDERDQGGGGRQAGAQN